MTVVSFYLKRYESAHVFKNESNERRIYIIFPE